MSEPKRPRDQEDLIQVLSDFQTWTQGKINDELIETYVHHIEEMWPDHHLTVRLEER
jgi:hypothetical protein